MAGGGGGGGGWESVEQRELAMAEEDAERERKEREEAVALAKLEGKGKGKARTSLNPYADYIEAASAPASPAAGSPFSSSPAPVATKPDDNDPYGGLDSFAEGLSFSSPSSRAAVPAPETNGGGYHIPPPVPAPVPSSTARAQPTFSSSNPYASLSLSTSSTVPSHTQALSESPSASSPFGSDNPFADGVSESTETRFLNGYVPEEPSSKALGKLRRVSEREGAFSFLLSPTFLSLSSPFLPYPQVRR